jgi:uncharacterized membrane protein YdjX (TVP38/TMEM64 family)/Fe-S oxidoreductase
MKPAIRIFLLIAIAILIFLFFSNGIHHHLSLENIKDRQAFLQNFYAGHPVLVLAAFTALYIPVVALNLPGALVLGLTAGALFGTLAGTILISFASSIGAALSCLLSRYLLRDWVHRRFRGKLDRVNKGILEESHFYLFALRLMPVIPFFIINMVMGVTTMRLWTFYWVSQLGMLPGTAVFVNAGSQIGKMDSLSGILSLKLILSLVLVGIFPLVARRVIVFLRKHHNGKQLSTNTPVQKHGHLLDEILKACTDCGTCQKSCQFLAHYGTPRQMAKQFDFSSPRDQRLAYECSLCGLCRTTCPEKLDLSCLFLDIRQHCVESQSLDETAYRAILGYEKRGKSSLFSWYGLPKGCDTVFFPGCTLPGTRPAATMVLFQQLQESIPALGIVLDCCAKPSHDIGRSVSFSMLFKEMKDYLYGQGIRRILTACPNCTKIFSQYGQAFYVQTVYQVLQEKNHASSSPGTGMTFSVHDPCAMRDDDVTRQAVRSLLSGLGHTVVEMKHHGNKTRCCGEGGMVAVANPGFATAWTDQRSKEANGYPIATYCAGCVGFLNRVSPAFHITDLLYNPEAVLNGKPKVAKAPFTYWNRLRLKHQFKKQIQPAVPFTRPSDMRDKPSPIEATQSQKI